MAKPQYYYPKGNHNLRLRRKAIEYIKNNPNASAEQIRYRISEKATNEKRRSITIKEIKELQKTKKIDKSNIYVVIGKLRIYDWDYSPPELLTGDYYQIEKEFLTLSSARNYYNKMGKKFQWIISEYVDIPNIEVRDSHLALTKAEWYNNEKRFPVIDESFW